MGSQSSKDKEQQGNGSSPSEAQDHQVTPEIDLSSYVTACQADPELQTLDRIFQKRTSRAINSISVDLEVPALPLDSLREVTECLLETNQDVVNVVLQCKEDIWKNPQLYDLVSAYLKNSLQILDFCNTLEACVRRALHSQSIILLALQNFEEEHANAKGSDDHYPRTLQELANFKAAGDPFTEEFFSLFQGVYNQQVLMLKELNTHKRNLDREVSKLKTWRKVSNVIFVAAFVSVLICAVVAATITTPHLVAGLAAAAAAVPLDLLWQRLNSMWSKYETDLKAQRKIIVSMQLGTRVVVKDLDGIKVLVDKLRIEIEALMENVDFATKENDTAVIVVAELKKKVNKFMKSIQELNDCANKCSRDISKARTVIMGKIINYPRSSDEGIGAFLS